MSKGHPLLYEVNTRVLLRERAQALGRPVTLDDLGDDLLDRVSEEGFDWMWLLGVWQTGPVGRSISRGEKAWRASFEAALPDLREEDIGGSPFAVRSYRADADLGGEEALRRTRDRLARRGLRLMLDFVPNHTARDHAWVLHHPEYYIHGTEADRERDPGGYASVTALDGVEHILAHGRDPYFPGWIDTFQLNYRHARLRAAISSSKIFSFSSSTAA